MSETATQGGEGDTGGIFCQGCSPTARKIGYYITNILGLFIFVYGIIDLIGTHVHFLIIGSFTIILAPLWIHNCSSCCKDLKNPGRLSSTILFLLFLTATSLSCLLVKNTILTVVCGVLLALSGIWYFLSFFENGQKACVDCMKACCCSDSENKS